MQKPITPEVIVAYAHCPRKAFLLLCTNERGTPHEYSRVLAQQQGVNRTNYINRLQQEHPNAASYDERILDAAPDVLLAATFRTQDLEAYCDVLTPVGRGASSAGHRYEPTLVVGTHTISKEQQLELLFAGYVLGQLLRASPLAGTIVGMSEQVHRVALEKRYEVLDPIISALRAWTASSPAVQPPVILNKHCPLCPFQIECVAQAERDDDLSLLERITPKERRRYHDRGIFTIRQLSYLFKPRRGKRAPKASAQHQPELQALALRTGKTYLHELPALTRHPVEFFLDIEGIPDRHAYYLLGLLLCHDGTPCYHAFWADAAGDEASIWYQLLARLDEYPDAPVYHYGSYEPQAVATLAKRYETDCPGLKQRLVNLNAHIHGKVYFPVRSNRLKDIGRFLGMSWTAPDASGLQSLVWRHRWEETQEDEDKQQLLTYNREDCAALQVLADELTRLRDTAAAEPAVDFAARPKRHATEAGEEIHRQFGAILRSAHAGYENAKISLQQTRETPAEKRRSGGQPGHQGYRRIVPKAGKVVRLAPRRECPRCENSALEASQQLVEKTIIDLVFTESGCRKTITRYVGARGYCRQCGRYYPPEKISAFGSRLFGHGLQVWVIYQRLVLRLPYRVIVQTLEDQFSESVSEGAILEFLSHFAHYYAATEDTSRQRLLLSPFIHVDETKVNIQGVDHHVWVFTDGTHVLFRMTKTREATIVHEMLAGYGGILISDFYGGYDAVKCRQQKCLVHLIRDLNEDLWRAPFDTEFEHFVLEVKNLIVPILEAVDRYGLKKQHLGSFTQGVERFYETVITGRNYRSELALRYQKRFQRYRQSLFTFLEHDGIPWNNNMAERAIRHLAVQRKISGSFYEAVAPQYLLLLGIAQTCRFQEKSLLKFLISGEKDVDAFKATKRIAGSIAVGSPTSKGRPQR